MNKFLHKQIVCLSFILVYGGFNLGCSPAPHQNEAHCIVKAFAVNQWGGRQFLDSWGSVTKPEKQPDGTFRFYNHFSETYITCPAGTEFIIEETQFGQIENKHQVSNAKQ